MLLNPSTKCTAALLFLLLSTMGLQAAERSDELFLPNPFGDEFRDVNLATEMASLSSSVYSVDLDSINNSSALSGQEQYTIVRFNDTGSTEVMIVTTEATDTSPARIIVVFRGTDASPDGDWDTNLKTKLAPFGPPEGPIVDETIYDDLGKGNGLESFDIMVHSGFNDALFSDNLYAELKGLLIDYLDDPMYNNTVYATGHSLGGANAQLFGTLLAYENPDIKIIITTFASPKVGNYGFKVLADSLKNINNWRFVNRQDAVPRGPIFPTGYYPAGHIMWKQPGENGPVVAYYRQTGDAEQGYIPIGSDFYTGMGIGMQCIEDHYMEYYVEWLDYAIENMQANYTCGFQGSNLTTCTGDSNEESNPSPRINQTESTSTSSYLFSFWCFFCNALPVLSFFVTHRNYFV